MKLFYIILFFIVVSCKVSQRNTTMVETSVDELFSDRSSCAYNSDSTMMLCTTTDSTLATKGIVQLSFSVLAADDRGVIYQDKLRDGNVEWIDAKTILVSRGLGYLNGLQNGLEKYFVDLETKERRTVPKEYKQK